MKRVGLVLFFFAGFNSLWPIDVDAGFGVNFGYNYSNIKAIKETAGSFEQGYGSGGIGQYIFFDFTYLEASMNFFFSNTSLKHHEGLVEYGGFSGDYNLNGVLLGMGLLLKYPFDLNSVIFYPLFGFEGNFYISQSFSKDYDWDDAKKGAAYGEPEGWNSFWLRFGAGADYFLSGGLFLRGELIFDLKVPNGLDSAYMKNERFVQANFSDPQFFGAGVTFRLAAGFKVPYILGLPQAPRAVPAPSVQKEKKPAPQKPAAPKRRDPNVYVPQEE
ncbi:MAG: hypothetical protein LBC53_03025 [Spirochaetaceae bacterium]|jgi:hypothetical protein|nr:hypothetical protein [Spirochaetaceae bacterium]